jgi:hypothetical protein
LPYYLAGNGLSNRTVPTGVSGKYFCRNPNDTMISEEALLDFTSNHKVVVSITYKNRGAENIDLPNIPPKEYRYTVEDKKVIILGVQFGLFGGNSETFLIQDSELVHFEGSFFKGKICKKS